MVNQAYEQVIERGRKATEEGVKAGEAGLHFKAATLYGTAVEAFMRARNEARAYEADGFRHYHLGTDAAHTGPHAKVVQHFDDAEIYFQRAGRRAGPAFWSYVCGGRAAHVRGLMALHALQYPEAARYFDRAETAFETAEALAQAGTPTSAVVKVNRRHTHALATYARAELALSIGECDKATSHFRESDNLWSAVVNEPSVPPIVTRDIQGWMYFVRGSANYTSALLARAAGNDESALELFSRSQVELAAAILEARASPAATDLRDLVRKRMIWVDYALSCAPAELVRGTPNDEPHRATIQHSAPSGPPVSAAPLCSPFIAKTPLTQSGSLATTRPRDRTPTPSTKASPTM